MTTKLQVTVSRDLFEENGDLVFPRPDEEAELPDLAAVTLLMSSAGQIAEARLGCLAHMHSRLVLRESSWRLHLLAAHSAWQTDSAWSRRRKLWTFLEGAGLVLPNERAEEVSLEGSEGVKFFGLASVAPGELPAADAILRAEPASLLVISDNSTPDAGKFIAAGWGRRHHADLEYWRDLGAVAVRHGSVLLRPFGAFDDHQVGFNLILSTKQAERVARALESDAISRPSS